MNNPIPQSPEELQRECLGTIWHVADDISRAAQESNVAALETHFEFLKTQMRRLNTIRTTVRQQPRTL